MAASQESRRKSKEKKQANQWTEVVEGHKGEGEWSTKHTPENGPQ